MKHVEILTIEEVAERLKLSSKSVRRRITSGKLLSFREGGRRLVLASDLEAYLEAQIRQRRSA